MKLAPPTVSRAAVLHGRNDLRLITDDGFGEHHLLNRFAPCRALYLRAKSEHFVLIGNHSCAVNRGQTGDAFDCTSHRRLPLGLTLRLRTLVD